MKLTFAPKQVQSWPLERLKPYDANARAHSSSQVAMIAASMAEFGWTIPCLVAEDGELIAGHGRVMAAQRLGLTEAPVIVVSHLTEQQRRAYRIADNRLTELGEWNEELLLEELQELGDADFDVSLTGFDADDIEAMLAEDAPEIDDDAEPDRPDDPVTQAGDLWEMGPHRILCGDPDDAAAETIVAAAAPSLMVCDLSASRVDEDGEKSRWADAWQLHPGATAYVWHDPSRTVDVAESLRAGGFKLRAQLVWTPTSRRGDDDKAEYKPGHDACWYAVRHRRKSGWRGAEGQSSAWRAESPKGGEGGAAARPAERARRAIVSHTSRGDVVLDPLAGNGATLIAAETCGRVCIAVSEIPADVDVAVRRWQNMTGRQATLAGAGDTFETVAAARME